MAYRGGQVKHTLPSYFIGTSSIWLLSSNFNFMCEVLYSINSEIDESGTVVYSNQTIVSPGFRMISVIKDIFETRDLYSANWIPTKGDSKYRNWWTVFLLFENEDNFQLEVLISVGKTGDWIFPDSTRRSSATRKAISKKIWPLFFPWPRYKPPDFIFLKISSFRINGIERLNQKPWQPEAHYCHAQCACLNKNKDVKRLGRLTIRRRGD
jgi:hypothetical protein